VGDDACWLGKLCPECGAMPTEDPEAAADRCWRCGEPYPERRDGPQGDSDPPEPP